MEIQFISYLRQTIVTRAIHDNDEPALDTQTAEAQAHSLGQEVNEFVRTFDKQSDEDKCRMRCELLLRKIRQVEPFVVSQGLKMKLVSSVEKLEEVKSTFERGNFGKPIEGIRMSVGGKNGAYVVPVKKDQSMSDDSKDKEWQKLITGQPSPKKRSSPETKNSLPTGGLKTIGQIEAIPINILPQTSTSKPQQNIKSAAQNLRISAVEDIKKEKERVEPDRLKDNSALSLLDMQPKKIDFAQNGGEDTAINSRIAFTRSPERF